MEVDLERLFLNGLPRKCLFFGLGEREFGSRLGLDLRKVGKGCGASHPEFGF